MADDETPTSRKQVIYCRGGHQAWTEDADVEDPDCACMPGWHRRAPLRLYDCCEIGDREDCRVYWGSHGCDLQRGHAADRPCECDCCGCPPGQHPPDPQVSGYLCVAKPPYYGPDTRFYGEDVEARGLPLSR